MSPEMEKFFGESDVLKWTKDAVSSFFANASSSLKQQEGLIFFVHLSSTDLIGHTYKPPSQRFQLSMRNVDETVAALEGTVERFFNRDRRTAFIFTSDHGMTDWGSHGAGHSTETATPLLAWGAGLRGPQKWPVTDRLEVAQIDLCPLMAAILGLELPANNQGRLPVALLNVSAPDTIAMMTANTRQLLEIFSQFRLGRQKKSLFFTEFARLEPGEAEKQLVLAEKAMKGGKTAQASAILNRLGQDALAGIDFFHRFDRFFHGFCVISTFLLWICCLVLSMLPPSSAETQTIGTKEMGFFFLVLFSQGIILLIESRPLLHWFYRLTPTFLLWSCLRHCKRLKAISWSLQTTTNFINILLGLEILVFGFFQRSFISLDLILNAAWQLKAASALRTKAGAVFLTSSLALAVFPFLPPISRQVNSALVPVGPLLTGVIFIFLLYSRKKQERLSSSIVFGFSVYSIFLILALVMHRKAHAAIKLNEDLPKSAQIVNWTIISVIPLLCGTICWFSSSPIALLNCSLAITIVHSILSINYETIFLLFLFVNVSAWVAMESNSGKDWSSIFFLRPYRHKEDDFFKPRLCFAYLLFIHLSFFGTGNIASINSFRPESVFCLVTVYKPYLMIPLYFLKLFLPLLLTTCVFSIIVANVDIALITKMSMILSDFMALHFFFLIKEEGSWEAIGTSISHYVISMALSLGIALLLCFARLLLSRSFHTSPTETLR